MFIFAKIGHSKFVGMHGDYSDFYPSTLGFYTQHRVNIILWSIDLFIYIQTCVNVNAYAIKKQTLNYSSFIPLALLQSDLCSDK